MGEEQIPSDSTGHDIIGLYPGHAQSKEGALTVWYSLELPGLSLMSPEIEKRKKTLIEISTNEAVILEIRVGT